MCYNLLGAFDISLYKGTCHFSRLSRHTPSMNHHEWNTVFNSEKYSVRYFIIFVALFDELRNIVVLKINATN